MNVATTIRISLALAAAAGTGITGLADTLRVPGEFPTIRAAIEAAVDGDEVLVADGVYTGPDNRNLDFAGKTIIVRSENGAENCVIDCELQARGFIFRSGEPSSAILSGFTITRGVGGARGGAILLLSSSKPTISNCILRENRGTTGGGAIACLEASSPTIIGCQIIDNDARPYAGGGIRIQDSSPRILDCTIERNSAGVGGGIYSKQGSPLISNCRIIGNSAWNGRSTYPGMGGGIHLAVHGNPRVENCLIKDNTSGSVGGGAYVHYYCSATFVNCTITGNSALDYGGGLDCTESVELRMGNCIVWGNVAPFGPEISNGTAYENGGTVSISYSDIRGGQDAVHMSPGAVLNWGPGNLDVAPGFAFSDDAHLTESAPCIDAGTNAPPGGLPSRGLDGNARPIDGDGDGDAVADIGAYEFNPTAPTIAVSATSFEFFAPLGGSDPPVQLLAIRNAGGGKLAWRAEENCSWLEVNSQPPETLLIRVDTARLGHGDQVCQVSIVADGAVNSPATIDITVHVNATLLVPQEYANIQSAVDASVDGDLILVADGIYTGTGNRDIDFRGKAITLRSTGGADNCTIDCDAGPAEHRGFYFGGGEASDTVLEGFTITRGNGGLRGGAILCENRSSPTIRECVLKDNRASFGGGIACIGYSNPTIVDSRFTGNTAESDGGGVFIGASREAASPKLDHCVFTDNIAVDSGGGVSIRGDNVLGSRPPAPLLTHCTIFNNRADRGGGIHCVASGPVFVNCMVNSNSSDREGGGLSSGNADPIIVNCFFTANTADGGGGGIFLQDSQPGSALITACTFTLNSATGASGGGGGGILVERASPMIARCRFDGNIGRVGGGIAVARSGAPTIIQCVITNNESVINGGGLSCGSDASRIINCLVADNFAHFFGGGFMFTESDAAVTNCTITRNTAKRRGGGVFGLDSNPAIRNGVIWDNRPNQVEIQDSEPLVRYCDVQDGWPGTGNIDADPLFVDPGNGDYRLAPGSPCIDAADNTAVPKGITTDLDGNPRFVDDPNTPDTGSGTPPIVDMGAYEFEACDPCDMNCDGDINAFDIEPFLELLFGPDPTPCDPAGCTGDANADGVVNAFDIEPFLNCLFP